MPYQNNKPLRILFVGRLEREKWATLLLDVIKRISEISEINTRIEWKIVWEGSLLSEFQKQKISNTYIYGHKTKEELLLIRQESDIAIVPSLFLETFWLVWLESLSVWLPVMGFKKWWLIPFVSSSLAIDEKNPIASMIRIIENIINHQIDIIVPDVSLFSLDTWRKELKILVGKSQKILLVSDYLQPIGWVEQYLFFLKKEIERLNVQVELLWYSGEITKIRRLLLFFLSPFSFWRGEVLTRVISEFNPDIIWWHALLRYHGIWTAHAMKRSWKPIYLTHHDFWLISARPSEVFSETDLPKDRSFSEFLKGSQSIFEKILRLMKYSYLSCFWYSLGNFDRHILPSDFMKPYYEKYTQGTIHIFHHTNF